MSHTAGKVHGTSKPAFCVAVQASKDVYLGDVRYHYDTENYLLTTLELPVTSVIFEASEERPYLSLRLELDQSLVATVMVEHGLSTPRGQSDAKALAVSPLDAGLLDATARLVRLLDSPEEAKGIMPLVKREIVYRLLIGAQGDRLRHLPELGGNSHRIARAVDRLKKEFYWPLRAEVLARDLGMSLSGFHQHFKAITELTPLQFQKQVRLHEARRLMLGENLDVASAGYKVGYDDPSHFSRDYRSYFGESPRRDVEKLRSTAAAKL
jgi:AraC-like DNA-binding protein